ncbi:MAG: calcium-binding protein [Pseudomonadota bacterium]
MATIIATSTNTQIDVSNGDLVYVGRDVSVVVAGSPFGATFEENQISYVIDGTVVNAASGIALWLQEDSATTFGGNSVTVGASGIVRGVGSTSNGVFADGQFNTINNFGEITGANGISLRRSDDTVVSNHGVISGSTFFGPTADPGDVGVAFNGVGIASYSSDNLLIENYGTITGYLGFTVDNSLGGPENNRLINYGEIIGSGTAPNAAAVYVAEGADGFVLKNEGSLIGASNAFFGSAFGDVVRNGGLMDGDVELGDGDDMYKASGDGFVDGSVRGGVGSDTIVGGSGDDSIAGGGFGDLLRGRAGDDTLSGANGQDEIFGGSGDDSLIGGSGSDTLSGGRGDDTLTGNSGGDTFLFMRADGNDLITDFQNGSDVIDLTAFGLQGSFADVISGALSNAGGGATLLDFSLIDMAGAVHGGSVLIEGLNIADANAADFVI